MPKTASCLIAFAVASCGFLAFGQKGDSSSSQQLLSSNPDIVHASLEAITSKRPDSVSRNADVASRFKVGDKIKFELIMTNTALVPVRILVWDTYVQDRPQLYRDGQLLKYRADIEELMPKTEEQTDFVRTDSILLEPHSTKPVEVISLADWYEALKPGHYQLSVRHRFQVGGKWIDSSSVTFEIDPVKQ